ncbi:uncharacterized protein TOT_040000706 [Theileria orientalis strain Shintoku]|uniref:Uncharacterized protein n=1 Tax=Theileria orientalis strain Shintoku TaxID=869250 RepID=J7M8I9_THEOR|nr:uncharacterized protein TOT_040000706 [Theileria orientalis strain Shintoku]BAM42338.1 uncharacterized protein TOT_040000706 [Theileria orientalis strain Shintoku]|eukprot:XP_009692639.1 uncharacterized protein TOT_040000706 [Theileria orientalis strain Shintoku]
MGMKEQSFYNKVIAVLIDRMDEANSMDLATIANTLVLLKNRKVHVDGDVVRSAATAISRMCMRREIMEEMSATNSVLIMYSFAKLEIMDWELFDKLLELMKKINKENFEPHQIPLVLHVFSVFNIKKDARMPLILDYIVETAGIMTYQNIANCLVSLARLNKRRYDATEIWKIGKWKFVALVENLKEKMETIKIRELGKWKENTNLTANILWSLGKLSYNDKEFVDECLRKVAECGDIDAISYAQVFEALKEYKTRRQGNVMLSMKDEELMEHLLNKYMKIMRSSPNQIITQVAWCCSVMDFDRNKVIEESLEELSKRKLNKVEQKYVNLFEGDAKSCVTRARFSPLRKESLAVAVDSLGYIRLMDLKAQKGANHKYFEGIFMENDMNLPHLCDFAFSNTGKCVYVSSSDGYVSVSAVNMIGTHLNKDNSLLTIGETHTGGTLCVCPSPDHDFILYTGGGDGFLKMWDLRLMSSRNIYYANENDLNSKPWSKPLSSLWAHVTPLSSISLKVAKRIVTCGFNENIRIWDAQTLMPIQTIEAGPDEMGVWDLLVDDSKRKLVCVGDLGGIKTYEYESKQDKFAIKNAKKIKQNDREGYKSLQLEEEDQVLFRSWKRICQDGKNLVIPRIDNEDKVKAYIIDMNTGKMVDSLSCNGEMEPKKCNISSVDVHPDPDVGLILSGG